MVIEFFDETNGWQAFPAAKTPIVLDDCLKFELLEAAETEVGRQRSAAFQRAASKLTSREVYELMPVRLPKTHNLVMPDGFEMKGIARYPLDQWQEEKRPILTEAGWFTLCAKIALKDMQNLFPIFAECSKHMNAETVALLRGEAGY